MTTAEQNTNRLTLRILDAFPSGHYALSTLLKLAEITESRNVATAAVECKTTPKLLVNPDFLKRHADTPEKLVMLVLHELHHILLGHTRLLERVSPLDNFIFDTIINALLCHTMPEPAYTALLTDFYSEDRFPDCLLRPPAGWGPTLASRAFPFARALFGKERRNARDIYQALYSDRGATYEDVRRILQGGITEYDAERVTLLGDHSSREEKAVSGDVGKALVEALQELAQGWPVSVDPLQGRSWGDFLAGITIKLKTSKSNRQRLRELLGRVGGIRHKTGAGHRWGCDETTIFSPLPSRDRRSVVLKALGSTPLINATPGVQRRRVPQGERVHVYVDVSGSVSELIPALYGAVNDCSEFVHPRIHLFSTAVATITLEQLRKGVCETTGGTSIDCVAEHIRQNHVRRAALITDGLVGEAKGVHADSLSSARLGAAMTGGLCDKTDLKPYVKYWAELTDN